MSRLSVPLRIHFLDNSKHLPNWPRSLSHFLLHHRKNVFAHRTEELPRCRHKKERTIQRDGESRQTADCGCCAQTVNYSIASSFWATTCVLLLRFFVCCLLSLILYSPPQTHRQKILKNKFGDISTRSLCTWDIFVEKLRWSCLEIIRIFTTLRMKFYHQQVLQQKMIFIEQNTNSSTTHLKLRERGVKENPRETFSCLIASQYCLLS